MRGDLFNFDLHLRVMDWDPLTVRCDTRRARVENPTDQILAGVVLCTPGGDRPLGDLRPGGEREVEW